jgi:hypothetical protein
MSRALRAAIPIGDAAEAAALVVLADRVADRMELVAGGTNPRTASSRCAADFSSSSIGSKIAREAGIPSASTTSMTCRICCTRS